MIKIKTQQKTFTKIFPRNDQSYSTHAVSPGALLEICQKVNTSALPECWLMEIRAYRFQLGEPLSAEAANNLQAARQAMIDFIRNKIPE